MVVVRSSTVREREEVGRSVQTFKFKIKKSSKGLMYIMVTIVNNELYT